MQLLVFCHTGIAYNVPDKVIEQAAIHDRNYEKGTKEEMEAAILFFKSIDEKYKRIIVGHLLTGDIG